MTDEFTYKITNKPSKEPISLKCPNCGNPLLTRVVPIGTTQGKDRCSLCGCEFEWSRK